MKILFVVYGLGIGGIEKCLVNLINALPEEMYDIDVLLMNPEYELKSEIKRECRFLDSYQYVMNTTDTMKAIQNHGGILKNIRKFFKYCVFRLAVKFQCLPWKQFDFVKKEYDIAVAYSHHDWSKYYVIDRVHAQKKFLFYHDGVYKLDELQKKRDKYYFTRFDSIIAVSRCTRNMLIEIYPELSDRIVVCYNIIDKHEIAEKAKNSLVRKENDIFYITTVGRMVAQKQPLMAVEIAKKLKIAGFKYRWFWVGDGNERDIVEQKIKKYGLGNEFLLIGNVINPYGYFAICDLYVQTSKDEAYCTTTNEARILGKPIVTTDCSGMDEQITDGITGYIVKNDQEEIYRKIEFLINNPDVLNALSENTVKRNVDFSKYINSYLQLFNVDR